MLETNRICMGDLQEVQINEIMDLIGKKWTLDVIKNIYHEKNRFNILLKENPKLSNKVLSEKLKQMEKDGLIYKEVLSENPIETEYLLTQKGNDLNKILFELNNFAYKHLTEKTCKDNVCKKTSDILKI